MLKIQLLNPNHYLTMLSARLTLRSVVWARHPRSQTLRQPSSQSGGVASRACREMWLACPWLHRPHFSAERIHPLAGLPTRPVPCHINTKTTDNTQHNWLQSSCSNFKFMYHSIINFLILGGGVINHHVQISNSCTIP